MGTSIAQLSWWLGTTEQTYYRWRKQYGEMKASQAMHLKDLEQEDLKKQTNLAYK
jgi:putative transposase